MMTLNIGSIAIPLLAALDIEQSYEAIGGEAVFRTVNGTGIKQSTWQKLRVTTSGGGWIPAGLETLDFTQPLTLGCILPRAVPADFSTRQATLPAARRTDAGHTPWGLALLPDGGITETALSLAGNVATLMAVSEAIAYQAMYLPQITVWASRPRDSGTRNDAGYRWELVAEEV